MDLKEINISIKSAQNYLLSIQHKEGYWAGLLEADVSVMAGFIPLMRFLGIKDGNKDKKAFNYLHKRQNSDGSWSLYYEGEGSLDVTVQSYFCFKMMGISPDAEFMKKARNFIISNGGIEKTNTYTKIILALFGQYPWKALPMIPPEIIFLPRSFYINIYDFASWTRATIMAFSIILTLRPVLKISELESVVELYTDKKNIKTGTPIKVKNPVSIEAFLILLVEAIKIWEKLPLKVKPGRKTALSMVEKWILQRQEEDGSWGGIMLPWLFSIIALKCMGYRNDHPVIKKGIEGLNDFIVENSSEIILQPATSPVWDTAWAIIALVESGVDKNNAALKNGALWLLKKHIKTEGDWKIKNPKVEPGCWSFEFYNNYYPDIDDTAIVCHALNCVNLNDVYNNQKKSAIKSGINWILGMQNNDGSWAAFDKNNNKKLLRHIPYADFITPLDFGSPDITAHVLNIFGYLNYHKDYLPVKKALRYLYKTQKNDGSWHGRWGVNYIYGTSKSLQAFDSIGCSFGSTILKAERWLQGIQNKDGGWGESCKSYEDKRYVPLKISTASQTAWALCGLLCSSD
ncbi:MAG: squalene--hopene cyclase, partial [Actinobacteria bacterium]|nr:squalene--hopene cyclase [Actinomycetota bacterium]MCG2790046.1 squalene--hopene cyclase [Actinomycetes bacterium]